MSAWNEITYADNSDNWTAMCDRALAEVRREQRREDAAKIRAWMEANRFNFGLGVTPDYFGGMTHAADLTDPEKEER